MSFHSKQSLGALHIAENWVYSTATARNSASGFLAGDIGKLAYQSDEGSYWRLLSTTPTWGLVGTSQQSPTLIQNWYFITALTGGASVNLDGQNMSAYTFGHLVSTTINDAVAIWQYQSGAPVSAKGDIAVLGNAGARFRKVLGI